MGVTRCRGAGAGHPGVRAGEALGVVSTHFHEAKAPKEEQLEALDVVAKRTSALLQAA